MMKKERKIFLCVLAAVTFIICIAAYRFGSMSAIHRAAANRLNLDIESKQEEYDTLSAEKSGLELEISDYKAQAEADSEMNVRMKDNEEKTEMLTAQIEEAKKSGEELDKKLEEAKKASSQANTVTSADSGKTKTLKEGTYTCPSDIEAGSYTLSAAEGNIIIYGTNGSIRVSKSLSVLDGNEYTIQIKDGERLKVDKAVSIRKR